MELSLLTLSTTVFTAGCWLFLFVQAFRHQLALRYRLVYLYFTVFVVAFFVNNIWDETAELALDRERGGRARFGYLTNQPRTFGFTTTIDF